MHSMSLAEQSGMLTVLRITDERVHISRLPPDAHITRPTSVTFCEVTDYWWLSSLHETSLVFGQLQVHCSAPATQGSHLSTAAVQKCSDLSESRISG